MTLTFLGAAGTVTGSKFLLTLGERRILVDAGLFQGEKEWRLKNWAEFPVDPSTVSDVVVTHAHLDHCGYLPALVRAGYRGPIWVTDGTRRLAEIVLRDAGFLQERDAEHAAAGGYSKHSPPLPLFTSADVERTLPLFRTVSFDTRVDLGDSLWLTMTRAGHILGAASVTLWLNGSSVLFSGDLGRHDHPVLRARDTPPGAAFVVVESTYGDREHPEPEGQPHEAFAEAIRRTVARGGSVLVPAYAVDRTEVVLHALTTMRREGRIPDLPVYVNSPMALAALAVYRDPDQRAELRADLRPADFISLQNLHAVRSTEESMALNNPRVPCIIIAASGMATGGRVLHHLEYMLPDPRNTVVLVGYQAAGTRGRALVEGARQLKMHGRYIPVRAEILQDEEFSVHADASDVMDWLAELTPQPETVFVVHGEPVAAEALATRISHELDWTAVVPRYGDVVSLRPRSSPAPSLPGAWPPGSS